MVPSTSGVPWRESMTSLWFLLYSLLLVLIQPGYGAPEKNQIHMVASLCKDQYLQNVYRKIDGAVLHSQNERNLDCTTTFQTESILQRFMLRFESLQLDCNDHLFIYDGAHAIGNYKADLSCRNTRQSVGTIYTRTNFVTLKYVTDSWGTESNGFRLIISAIKDPKHACPDFRCKHNYFCIDKDLVCDGINHCGDNSDEAASTLCAHNDMSTVFGLSLAMFIGIVVVAVVVCCVFVGSISICMCRRRCQARLPPNQPSPGAYPMQATFGTNGSTLEKMKSYPPGTTCVLPSNPTTPVGLAYYQTGGYTTGGGTFIPGVTPTPTLQVTSSGNLLTPAGGFLGYFVLRALCCYLAK